MDFIFTNRKYKRGLTYKYYENQYKKIVSFMIIMGLVINMHGISVYVKANEIGLDSRIILVNTNAPNLRYNDETESKLLDKLQYDKDRHTTDMPKAIEKELNEVGLFDNEIEMLDEKTKEKIINSKYSQIAVVYHKENEVTGEKVNMNADEINALIKEKIESEKCHMKNRMRAI